MYKYHYEIAIERESFTFDVELDEALNLIPLKEAELSRPSWTALSYRQCHHCPISNAIDDVCPVAAAISDVIEQFDGSLSVEPSVCRVVTQEREYLGEVPLQQAIYSLLGLIMPTSGCPHLAFLKPMARYHLPFATSDETIIRSTSMYLLAQFFGEGEGDYGMEHITDLFQAVSDVNRGIVARLRSANVDGDADKNALITLDSFAQILSLKNKRGIESVAPLFREL